MPEDVLPDSVRDGDVAVRSVPSIPVDIFAPPPGRHRIPARLTSGGIFRKSGVVAGAPPSPDPVSGLLAVQQSS